MNECSECMGFGTVEEEEQCPICKGEGASEEIELTLYQIS